MSERIKIAKLHISSKKILEFEFERIEQRNVILTVVGAIGIGITFVLLMVM